MQHVVDTKKESPSSEDPLTDGSQNDGSTKKESDEVKKVVICFNFSQALTKDCNKSEYKFCELQVSRILCIG